MARYQIRVKELLPLERAASFEGVTVTHAANGGTLLTGDLPDQTALYSLLLRARDLSLTLLSVTLLDNDSEAT